MDADEIIRRRNAAARRQAELRRRRRHRLAQFRIEIDSFVADDLVRLSWLRHEDADNDDAIAAALAKLIRRALEKNVTL